MIKNKIKVLIIEDSALYQAFLRQVVESDDCLCTVGAASSGSQALELIPRLQPDIITLDLQLPDMSGFDLLAEIVRRWNLPVIVVSGDADACKQAIQLGARDFIEKIQDAKPKTAEQFRLLLKLKLKMQTEPRPSETAHALSQAAATGTQPTPAAKPKPSSPRLQQGLQQATALDKAEDLEGRIIAIGASLGGTEVTLSILQQLPTSLPGIVIVQHMPPDYTSAYALRLDRYCDIEVREAKDGDRVQPGTALVAKGGEQLKVCRAGHGFRVEVGGTEKHGGFCPSVDVMFESVAKAAGQAALGVILTGMGKDGAQGLKLMHDSGAYTLGQDEESCAVFGMPGVAWSLGAVDKLLPPDKIAVEIRRHCLKSQRNEAEDR